MVSSLPIGSSNDGGEGFGSSGSISPTHADNPLWMSYETFQRSTPTITRIILMAQAGSWILSFFVDLTFALSNVPYFTLMRFEVYRILTSLIVCNSFFSLLFAYFSFVDTGRRMEQSMGSTSFATLLLTIGVTSNVLYIVLAALLDTVIVGRQYFFILPAFGPWIVLFGIVAMECTTQQSFSPGSTRKLFVVEVPTLCYPLCLFGLFSLLGGGFQGAHLISIALGYGFGFGYLDKWKVSTTTCRRWEESFLQNISRQDGWVLSSNAGGTAGVWNEDSVGGSSPGTGGGGFSSIFSQLSPDGSSQQSQQPGGIMSSPTRSSQNDSQTQETSSMPQIGGRQLGGGPSRRQNGIDAREARLKAIEKRMAGSKLDAENSV